MFWFDYNRDIIENHDVLIKNNCDANIHTIAQA